MKNLITPLVTALVLSATIFISCDDSNAVATTPVDGATNDTLLCMPDSLQVGLVAAYPFGADSIHDVVGDMDLTAFNVTPAEDRNGNANCAYQFLGSNDSFLIANNTAMFGSLNNMSISLWYQPQGTQADYELLIGRSVVGSGPMRCPDTYGDWSIGLYDARKAVFGYNNSVWEQGNPSDATDWKHVVVTLEKGTNILTIYINGVFQETKTGTAGCGAAGTELVQEQGDLYIGELFNGKIDDIAIYGTVLTQAQVTALYSLEACCQ